MDFRFLLEDFASLVVFTWLPWLLKKLFVPQPASPAKHRTPAKSLRKQFFVCLFLFGASLFAFASIRPEGPLFVALRYFLGLLGGFSFLLVWGAFDAAFSFYPPDDPHTGVPDDPRKDRLVDPSPIPLQPSVEEKPFQEED